MLTINDLDITNRNLNESIIFAYYEATITLDGLAYVEGIPGYTPIAGWTNCCITEWINVAILCSISDMSYCVKLTDRYGNNISGGRKFWCSLGQI